MPRSPPIGCAACGRRSEPAQPSPSPASASPISARTTGLSPTPDRSLVSSLQPQSAPTRAPASLPNKVASFAPASPDATLGSEPNQKGNPDSVRKPQTLVLDLSVRSIVS